MKLILCIVLCLITLLTLAACGGQPGTPITDSKPATSFPVPTIHDKLTWKKINAFPIKTEDMSIEDARKLCVDFMRFSKTALYIPDENMTYQRNTTGTQDNMVRGQIYGGLPYVGLGGCSSIYRLMDYIDEETGVVDMTNPISNPALFGSHCSSQTYWAWGRVISSVGHAFTWDIIHNKGYLRVGPYTYDDTKTRFDEQFSTYKIVEENGQQTMCQSYAQLLPADGVVNYRGGGHVMMISSEPVVVYMDEAKTFIDPNQSYVYIIDQHQGWQTATNDSGDTYTYKANVDVKFTFSNLMAKGYLPFTYAEFTGEKPIEATQYSCTLSGETITSSDLFNAAVTSNFGISDIYVTIRNDEGQDLYRHITRAHKAGLKELTVVRAGNTAFTEGNYDALNGTYPVEVKVQLSTGERPVIYSGKVTIVPGE